MRRLVAPLPALAISAVLLAAAPTGDATAPAAKPPGVQLAARCFHYSSKVVGFQPSKGTLNLDAFGHGYRTISFA